MTEKYGTDALRFSLVYGVAPASDIVVSEDKIRAHRNFVNKIWNASRFVMMTIDRFDTKPDTTIKNLSNPDDLAIIKKLNSLIKSTTSRLDNYRFGQASEDLYQFFWHDFCDVYIESSKDRLVDVVPVLLTVLTTSLQLLHPFIPFVTESIFQSLKDKYQLPDQFITTSSWPTAINEKT